MSEPELTAPLLCIPYRSPGGAEMRRAIAARALARARWAESAEGRAFYATARAEADAAATALKAHGASHVWLFGSLARGDADARSDIDLAVEGLSAQAFFRASAAADRVVTRRLDVIDLADAAPLLRQRVAEDGIEL